MNWMESFRVAIASLVAHKMRSFLTMLGIIIGISSVITIVALGQGSQASIEEEFENIGTNRFYVRMNWRENPSYRERFDDYDIEQIKNIFKEDIEAVSPYVTLSGTGINGRDNSPVYLIGVNEDYSKIQSFEMNKGRFLLESDVKGEKNIGVIDEKLALKLFKRQDVVGEKITIDTGYSKVSMIIGGVYKTQPSLFDKINEQFGEVTTAIYMPITTMKKLGTGHRYYMFEVNAKDSSKIDSISKDMIKLIERRHRNTGKDYYMVETAQQSLDIFNSILGTLSAVIGAIAAISLMVGSIGVMNIMLVSVTERTREIGIRKAIGATRRDILIQFLVEAMIITATGGFIGTVLGLTIQTIIAMMIGITPSISVVTIAIAVLFSGAVGILSGIYPANKAAKLDPIEALRYE